MSMRRLGVVVLWMRQVPLLLLLLLRWGARKAAVATLDNAVGGRGWRGARPRWCC